MNNKFNILMESIIDWTRTTLDLAMFNKRGDQYELKPEIKQFLQEAVNYVDQYITKVHDAFIKGSILSFQWLDTTDVDLLLEIDEDIDDERWRHLMDLVDEHFEGYNIPGTEHPLQVYLNRGKYDLDNADGVLYLDERGWLKGPYNLTVNVDDYMSKFLKVVASIDISTGELKRDIIDYDLMKRLPPESTRGIEQELAKKLEEIENDIDDLLFQYKHIKEMRHKAFLDDMTPEELAKFGSKNKLPENVIFKLLERAHYIRFLSRLKEIAEDGIEDNDINIVKQMVGANE